MRRLSFLLLIPVVAALSACSEKPKATAAVAKVNGSPILLSSFENQANRLAHFPGNDFTRPEKRKELLDELVKQELLFEAGMAAKIIEKSDRLKIEVARAYLSDQVDKNRQEPIDSDVKAYFDAHKAELEKIRASHVLIKPKDPQSPKSWDEAKARAGTVLRRIRAEKERADFAKYAKQYSEDEANRNQGGDLGFFDRKKMVPSFTEAAFALAAVGDISDAVKSDFGWHIIKLTADQRSFDSHARMLKMKIAQQRRKEKADQLFTQLKKNARITVYEDVLSKANVSPPMPLSAPHPLPPK